MFINEVKRQALNDKQKSTVDKYRLYIYVSYHLGDENLHLPNTSAIQPPDNSPSKEVSPENGRGTSRETKTEDGEHCPGFYYQFTRKQRDGKKAQKGNAKPRKVILYEEGKS